MKTAGLYIMAISYVLAGIMHFLHPGTFKMIMPSWIPWQGPVIFITGIMEILFGLFLIPGVSRIPAAWCLIIFLILVFPANVQMAINFHHLHNPYLWLALLRLPLQAVLIYWAWTFTK